MVVAEADDVERGQPALLLEALELLEPDVDARVVRDREVVGRIARVDLADEARDRGRDRAALRLPGRELAVAADAHARARGEVPDVAVGGGGEVAVVVADLVAAFAQVEAAALAVERRPQLLDGVGRVGRGRVGVAVVAHLGVHVEVVEQHELARDRVGVRRHVLAEERQVRVAVALGHVPEHLVVGAVLADHVEDVLDRRGLADAPRDRRALGAAGRRVAAPVVVGADRRRPAR